MEADGGVRVPGAGKNGITAERVEQERELIQDVAACVLSGQSLKRRCDRVASTRDSHSQGNFWSPQNLRQMLLSPSIAGYRTHHGNLIEGTWKPIIPRNPAKARRALADPSVRAMVLALLGGDDCSRRRERRIAAVRLELAGLEVRWPLLEEDERKP